MNSASFKLISDVPTAEELKLHEELCNTKLATKRLRELVPLLDLVGCEATQISREKTVLEVPLLESAMNQNGTHQASVFYLVADYTLGIGMFAAIPGCYTVGVHDRCNALPVQFWLRSGTVNHVMPGTGTIRAECAIPPDVALELRKQLQATGRCQIEHDVKIFQGGDLVAVARHRMGMYADVPRQFDTGASLTQVHNLKTSALMIAGLRDDPVSQKLAGDQGRAIAKRMSRGVPQLPGLVKARGECIERLLLDGGTSVEQVVILGTGLDSKSLRYPGKRFVLCDLAEMLDDRRKRLDVAGYEETSAVEVAVDFRVSGWHKLLLGKGALGPGRTLFIFEGVSMYLTRDELLQTLEEISLVATPDSVLWLDHVMPELLSMKRTEVETFLSHMARLGEPFINAFDRIEDLGASPWRTVEKRKASEFVSPSDEIHDNYHFSLLQLQK